MLVIRAEYLTGRVYSSNFADGDRKKEPEWPPHPARLFSALVSAWGETDKDNDGRIVLEWLEQLPPPSIHFDPNASHRTNVTVYVPVNDPANIVGQWKSTAVDSRPLKPRQFPNVSPERCEVFFEWPQAPIEPSQAKALKSLFRCVPYLGSSMSLVALSLADTIPDGFTCWNATSNGREQIRVVYPDRLAELEQQHEQFQSTGQKSFRPTAGRIEKYGPAVAIAEKHHSIFQSFAVLKLRSEYRLGLFSTLKITQTMRSALMKSFGKEPAPWFISGHSSDSTEQNRKPSHEARLALVPLPDVAHPFADGHLMGIGLAVPANLSLAEQNRIWVAAHSVRHLTLGQLGVAEIESAGMDAPQFALHGESWSRPSRVWATVTPIVLDRFPRKNDRFGPEAEETIRKACGNIGLPEPAWVNVLPMSPLAGVPSAAEFPGYQTNPARPLHFHVHAVIGFDKPVGGPVILGAGRYLGYGFMRPWHQRETE